MLKSYLKKMYFEVSSVSLICNECQRIGKTQKVRVDSLTKFRLV